MSPWCTALPCSTLLLEIPRSRFVRRSGLWGLLGLDTLLGASSWISLTLLLARLARPRYWFACRVLRARLALPFVVARSIRVVKNGSWTRRLGRTWATSRFSQIKADKVVAGDEPRRVSHAGVRYRCREVGFVAIVVALELLDCRDKSHVVICINSTRHSDAVSLQPQESEASQQPLLPPDSSSSTDATTTTTAVSSLTDEVIEPCIWLSYSLLLPVNNNHSSLATSPSQVVGASSR